MLSRAWAWVVVALCACGRVGFDGRGDAAVIDDARPDALLPLCDRVSNALYCDDFDDGDSGEARRIGGMLAGGEFVATAAPGQQPRLQLDLPAAVTGGALHIGGRMQIEAGPMTQDFVVLAQAISPQFVKSSFDLVDLDRIQLTNFVVGGGAQAAPGSMPRGRDVCFELGISVDVDGGMGAVTAWIDDDDVITRWQGQATLPAGGYTRIEVGAVASDMNIDPVTVRYDSVIIASQRIGCP